MQFKYLFSDDAVKLAEWAIKENDRLKASCIMKAAFNVEEGYRKKRGIPRDYGLGMVVGGCYWKGTSISLLQMVMTAPPPPPPPKQPRSQ
jgi:hypothetical protein